MAISILENLPYVAGSEVQAWKKWLTDHKWWFSKNVKRKTLLHSPSLSIKIFIIISVMRRSYNE